MPETTITIKVTIADGASDGHFATQRNDVMGALASLTTEFGRASRDKFELVSGSLCDVEAEIVSIDEAPMTVVAIALEAGEIEQARGDAGYFTNASREFIADSVLASVKNGVSS